MSARCRRALTAAMDALGTYRRSHLDPWRVTAPLANPSPPLQMHRRGFAKKAPVIEGTPSNKSAEQPRASTDVTEREILAHQRSPEDYLRVPMPNVRNFSIVAHVDHGKSTLADRLLELTGSIPAGGRKQYLDRLPVERARGITVKAQSVSLLHECARTGETYLLNLIDTPGHADFAFEVSRSLAACQGALLLVDAAQGIQAQTIATFFLAMERDLAIIPVANKIDSVNADVEGTGEQLESVFGIDASELVPISAKVGTNVGKVLDAVVERVPAPSGDASPTARLRALLLDCHYDPYRGAVASVAIVDGAVKIGDKIRSMRTGSVSEVLELGLMTPEPLKVSELTAGRVGYVITSQRDVRAAKIGDTLVLERDHQKSLNDGVELAPLNAFREAKPMVFQGLFPTTGDDYEKLKGSVERLTLNDASVSVQTEVSAALGPGFRCGFLGLLHADVFHQRLREEFGAEVIATAPTVPYKVTYPGDTESVDVSSPMQLDVERLAMQRGIPRVPGSDPVGISEPMVDATIVCKNEHVGKIVELCVDRRGTQLEHTHMSNSGGTDSGDRVLLRYRMPMGEVAVDFADELKSRTSGYATFDYEESGYEQSDIVRLDVLINGQSVDALAGLIHRDKATRSGKAWVTRLREILPRQLFEVKIQAAVGTKVLARESISAYKKDVLANYYAMDKSRKQKLLNKQKKGKKYMKSVGSVEIPNEAFAGLLSKGFRGD